MGIVDFHNHMIPGVDDGSESIEQSVTALKKMWDQGITTVITTPHFRSSAVNCFSEFDARIKEIDNVWGVLVSAAEESLPGLALYRGVELALDEPLTSLVDERVRLAGTRFLLVEFPYLSIPPNSADALARLRTAGVTPIVAHPERYENLGRDVSILVSWKRSGAFLQVNAGSFVGHYGHSVQAKAWKTVETGLADFLCSDYHARGNCMTELVRERFERRGAKEQFDLLTTCNGDRLISGGDPLPVPAVAPTSKWTRLKRSFRRRR
jgi:protein-tyrosine phosphatase